MSLRSLEAAILREARTVTGIKKLRQADIVEWTTGTIAAVARDEKVYALPNLGVQIAIKASIVPAGTVKP